MISPERLFLNDDRSRVVREGDPAAAFLLAAKGSEVPEQYVKLAGKLGDTAAESNTAAPDKPDRKTRVAKPLSER